MGRFDKAREAAQKLGESAQKLGETARDKTREIALQRKFDALAKDVGDLVFRQREGESGLDAEIERLVSEMRGVRSEMDALD
ncbi:MAG: hypothetical protein QOK40_1078 [Miltoncostaeaceae bacterium]|jgi:hypothetical protein|nr:hypothetical protein [Miltoncostaeaceae bacterium]